MWPRSIIFWHLYWLRAERSSLGHSHLVAVTRWRTHAVIHPRGHITLAPILTLAFRREIEPDRGEKWDVSSQAARRADVIRSSCVSAWAPGTAAFSAVADPRSAFEGIWLQDIAKVSPETTSRSSCSRISREGHLRSARHCYSANGQHGPTGSRLASSSMIQPKGHIPLGRARCSVVGRHPTQRAGLTGLTLFSGAMSLPIQREVGCLMCLRPPLSIRTAPSDT